MMPEESPEQTWHVGNDAGISELGWSNVACSGEKNEKISQLTKELEVYKHRIKSLEFELKCQKQLNEEGDQRYNKMQEIRDQMIGIRDIIANNVQVLKALQATQNEKIADLEKRLKASTEERDKLQEQLLRQEQDGSEMEATLREEMTAEDQNLQDATAMIDHLRCRVQQLQEQQEGGGIQQDCFGSGVVPFADESCLPQYISSDLCSVPDSLDERCQFCSRRKLQAQDWTYHYSNCPDSRKWHGFDTQTPLAQMSMAIDLDGQPRTGLFWMINSSLGVNEE